MDRRSGNALDMESDGFPLRNKKRNFDRGQIPVFKIPLLLQMVGIERFDSEAVREHRRPEVEKRKATH